MIWSLLLLLLIPIWYLGTRKKRLRKKLLTQKLTPQDWEYIGEHAQIVAKAPAELREKIDGLVSVLLSEKNYELVGEFDDEMRKIQVVTMAQAALLLVAREHKFYPILRSVIFYPQAFTGGRDEDSTRLGESWGSGSVVLSWHSVCKGGEDSKDGHNVVIHEFAHQLDQETGAGDGVPYLADRGDYASWAKDFQKAYEAFCEEVEAGQRTVLDDYGATNAAEFFAVSTETFFEKAEQLQEARPNIYEQLKRYYGLDPAAW